MNGLLEQLRRAKNGSSAAVLGTAKLSLLLVGLVLLLPGVAWAQKSEPANVYLFPAGGQRGTDVEVSIHGENLTSLCDFHVAPGHGVTAPAQARDRKIRLHIAPDAPLGPVPFRIGTAEGGAGTRVFLVGEYPETRENEPGVDDPTPQQVRLPVTVNGRLDPAGDVDRYRFSLHAGQPLSAEVFAARLGGPIDTNCFVGQFGNPPEDPTYKQLDATLELYGPDGKLLSQAEDTFGLDPALGIVAPRDGEYVIAVHHMAHLGMPQFVYRLTLAPVPLILSAYPAGGRRGTTIPVTLLGPNVPPGSVVPMHLGAPGESQLVRLPGGSTPFPLAVSDLPEILEQEPNDTPAQAKAVALPAVLNGRFQKPGDADTVRVTMRKGETWRFEAWVQRVGSPTDSTISVLSVAGKVIASAQSGGPAAPDPLLFFTAPADGEYLLQIREAGMSRLGDRLVYRLEAVPQRPDFQAELKAELLDTQPGGAGDMEVSIHRLGGFSGPIRVAVTGLPEGVSFTPLDLKAGQDKARLHFTTVAGCRSGSWPVKVLLTALPDGVEVTHAAAGPVANPADTALGAAPRTVEDLLLTVRFPPPFKIEADDFYNFLNLGTLFPARIVVKRDPGFTAPLLFTMADRQPRNPYGITFEPMTVTGMDKEVFFPMRLPQGPRGNEIVRVYVKAEGVTKDRDGREWHVLQTSEKQVVSRTLAPVLSLGVEPDAMRVKPGATVPVRFRLGRTSVSTGAAEVRLLPTRGMTGISMAPVTVAAGVPEAEGSLRVDSSAVQGNNSELWFEVTSHRDNGQTIFYDAKLTFDLR